LLLVKSRESFERPVAQGCERELGVPDWLMKPFFSSFSDRVESD
jgi:hypothetical protein